jgi:general secretion pathway protein D
MCGSTAGAQTVNPPEQTAQGASVMGSASEISASQPSLSAQAGDHSQAPAETTPGGSTQTNAGMAARTPVGELPRNLGPAPNKRQLRDAEDAYLAGAKRLEHDDLDAAESEFTRALKLNPENRNYAIAVAVAREHRLAELVGQSTRARQAGDSEKADTLLAEARAIDPESPIVLEHSEPVLFASASRPAAAQGQGVGSRGGDAGAPPPALADRTRMIADADIREPWRIEAPELAGAIRLTPSDQVKTFHLRGTSDDVIRNVASSFGIATVIDDLDRKDVQFDIDNVRYAQAMDLLMSMTRAFAVTVDPTTVMVAKDSSANRQRLERQLEETIYLPGSTNDQINEIAQVVRNLFEVKQATVQTGLGSIVVRAPEEIIDPMNKTIEGLVEANSEVMVEVKMYEVDTTKMTNVGATLPTQFSAFNVGQEAASIVSSNQTLVQQAIAQGLISASASNLEIALALIGAGLVQSSLATNLIGVVGGGLLQTGISASSSLNFNLALNSTDTRALDDVQMRVGNRQSATFREGTKYPITSSTYTTGLSTSSSALSNATINGVSVASLLSQYTGGSSATIPQVTYEDLGVTLKTTPVVEKSGRINLLLDMKIEALSGSTNDGNPILESRQFASDITVADGESAMMVSSVSKTETAAMSGIPGLSELPGFQMPTQVNTEKDTSQLVVLVIPHVVRRRSDMMASPRIPVHPGPAD